MSYDSETTTHAHWPWYIWPNPDLGVSDLTLTDTALRDLIISAPV